jgi:hypothetical protein
LSDARANVCDLAGHRDGAIHECERDVLHGGTSLPSPFRLPPDPQTGNALMVDGRLPGREFLYGQLVSVASIFQGQVPEAHGVEDGCLLERSPTLDVGS